MIHLRRNINSPISLYLSIKNIRAFSVWTEITEKHIIQGENRLSGKFIIWFHISQGRDLRFKLDCDLYEHELNAIIDEIKSKFGRTEAIQLNMYEWLYFKKGHLIGVDDSNSNYFSLIFDTGFKIDAQKYGNSLGYLLGLIEQSEV